MSYFVKEIFLDAARRGNQRRPASRLLSLLGLQSLDGTREQRRAARSVASATPISSGTNGPGGGKFATVGELADTVVAMWRDDPFIPSWSAPVASRCCNWTNPS